MIEKNQALVGDPRVIYVCADIFEWEPEHSYDTVFFSFWLSHVPPDVFEDFWSLVDRCLVPTGRVCFMDEDDRAAAHDDVRLEDGVPVATRKLADGREFDIAKIFWRPADLELRLRSLGWDIGIRRVGDTFLYGTGCRR